MPSASATWTFGRRVLRNARRPFWRLLSPLLGLGLPSSLSLFLPLSHGFGFAHFADALLAKAFVAAERSTPLYEPAMHRRSLWTTAPPAI